MTTLLFDFDGTIAESFSLTKKILQNVGEEFGVTSLSDSEFEELRDQDIKTLLKQFNIPALKLPMMVFRVRQEMQKMIEDVEVIPGLETVLQQLKNQSSTLGIISSNSKENIQLFLEKNNLSYFDFVYSEKNLFGKGKVIRKVLRKFQFDQSSTFYIGDEIRDILAARVAGIRSVAVTWGFNSRKGLKNNNPDYLIEKPIELLSIVA